MTEEEAIKIAQGLITDFKHESETMVEFCNVVIKALEQQPCEDCVSRAQVIDLIRGTCSNGDITYFRRKHDANCFIELVGALPSVNPQPKIGHWIENAPEYQNIDPPYICSECGHSNLIKTNYCEQCGAKMLKILTGSDSEVKGRG